MSATDFVVLPGLTLPLAAVRLALDLEARGLHLHREDGDVLVVGPKELLTDQDRAGLRKWKPHLLAIVTYEADVLHQGRAAMNTRPAFVQSVFDYAIREINALEGRIVETEDDADALLWEQAGQVVAQLEAGLSQRQLAAQWINVRTGEPHSVAHVNYTVKVYRVQFTEQPRPRFRDAYNTLSNTSKRLAQNTGCFEWYTPADVIEAARTVLGAIDLDPASSEQANTVVKAARFFTRADDGLAHPWSGRVWLNPPFSQPLIEQFADKLAASVTAGDVPAALVITNNATETVWFTTLMSVATAICFPRGRVRFWQPNVTHETGPLQGQAVTYTGRNTGRFAGAFRPFGEVWFR